MYEQTKINKGQKFIIKRKINRETENQKGKKKSRKIMVQIDGSKKTGQKRWDEIDRLK